MKCARCAYRWFADPASLSDVVPGSAAQGQAVQQNLQSISPQSAEPPADELFLPPKEEALDEEAVASPPQSGEPSAEALFVPAKEEALDENTVDLPPPIPSEDEITKFHSDVTEQKKSTFIWWILLLAVIALVVGSLFGLRREIAAFYPPVNKLYVVLGLRAEVPGSGLEIADFVIASRQEGNNRILLIKGGIKNTTAHVLDVPLLMGAIKDSKGKELYIWSFSAKERRVPAGKSVVYETEVPNPARDDVNVIIAFTTEVEFEAKKAIAKNVVRVN